MWNCSKCDAIVDDALDACHRCGALRVKAELRPAPPEGDESAVDNGASEAVFAQVVPEFQPRIEPPVASTLAVWVWILAVFAIFPILGLAPALALAVCSAIVALRRERYAWDRRIGVGGLIVALGSLGIAGLWIVMLFVRAPSDLLMPGEFVIDEERSWPVTAMQLGVLVLSIVLHECAHGVSAYWSGDGTAARLGRIRLNPLAHIDLFGSIILPGILLMTRSGVVFGWAKPVPVNRLQFRSPRRGLLAVTLAGVSVNMMLAMICTAGLLAVGSALRIAYPAGTSEAFMMPFAQVKLQGVANAATWELVITGLKQGMLINLFLFTLNILPIPPLDGYGVLESLAPPGLTKAVAGLRSFGFILLIVLIVSGVLIYLVLPGIIAAVLLNWAVGAMTGWG
jgi:Zn-dependent protease